MNKEETRKAIDVDEIESDSWLSDYILMQVELISFLQYRMSWHDRVQVSKALTANRREFEQHREEMGLFEWQEKPQTKVSGVLE